MNAEGEGGGRGGEREGWRNVAAGFTTEPMGDAGVMVRCDDEAVARRAGARLRRCWRDGALPAGVTDVVTAFATVAVIADPEAGIVRALEPAVIGALSVGTTTQPHHDGPELSDGTAESALPHPTRVASRPWVNDPSPISAGEVARSPSHLTGDDPPGRLHRVPVCYEMGDDLAAVAEAKGLNIRQAIDLHAGREYPVAAIGFCPGFPYLGGLPAELAGLRRRPTPRTRVEAGTVAIAGARTCIYTLARPAGWHVVGRTPLTLVDEDAGWFPLRTGDRVVFEPVTRGRFDKLAGRRLEEG